MLTPRRGAGVGTRIGCGGSGYGRRWGGGDRAGALQKAPPGGKGGGSGRPEASAGPSQARPESRGPPGAPAELAAATCGSARATASNPSMAAMTGERTAPEVPMPARPTSAKVVPAAPPSMPPFGTAQPASPGRVVLGVGEPEPPISGRPDGLGGSLMEPKRI